MRNNIIKAIFKKEITEIFRDKKTIFAMILTPILLYPIMMIGSTQLMNYSMDSLLSESFKIATNFTPDPVLETLLSPPQEENANTNTVAFSIVPTDDYLADIENQTISAYLEKIEGENGVPNYQIYINSAISKSSTALNYLKECLKEYKLHLTKTLITDAGFSSTEILEPIILTSIDVAPKEQQLGVMLGSFLPFLLITGIVSGAIYPAIDAMAGEKERGTLETLLTLPVSNTEIVTGKFFAIAVVGLITAILHILSIIISIGILLSSMLSSSGADLSQFTADLNLWTMIPSFLITILSVLIFTITITALSISVCSFAKSYKDAQNYLTPLTLIFMLPSMVTIIPNMELSSFTALIPVVNIALLIKGVLIGRIGLELVFLALLVNLAFAGITIAFMSKIFNSEAVLFSSNFTFDFLEKRSDIKPKKLPNFSEGIVFYFVVLVAFLIISSILQPLIGTATLVITQLFFLGCACLFAWYVKADFKTTFSLRLPKIRAIVGSLILYAGAFIFVQLLSNLMFTYIPFVRYMNEQLSSQIVIESLFLNLLIVAVLPAICEEFLFRGVLYASISSKCSPRIAILISGILFGIMHLDPARIVLTSILGIVFAYTLYQSKSIFIPILLHLINNGMAVVIEHNTPEINANIVEPLTLGGGMLYFALSVILCVSGIFLVKKRAQKNN